jgi:HPt (histidine-containing phosphotransfer) domain-containing protein
MDAYVSKPLQPQELFEVLEGLVPAAADAGSVSAGSEARPAAFDLAAALERMDGDVELMTELAGLFLSECPQRMAEIRQAITQRNASRLQQGAHALKGSVGNFGAQEAFEAAGRLERDGRDQDWGQAEADWTALEEAIGRLEPAFIGLGRAGVP